MQDRYVGDVGDYGKYALLRALCGNSAFPEQHRLAVIWCLFPDESHNGDGRHISYLKSGHLRALDPELHDALNKIVEEKNRCVKAIEQSNILPSSTVYFDPPPIKLLDDGRLPSPADRLQYRENWLRRSLDSTRSCELVFFDPDNGVEAPSVNKRNTKAGKYIFRDELIPFFERGQSLIIYHHLNRTASVQNQVEFLNRQFREAFPKAERIIPLVYRRGSCRVFWLVATKATAQSIVRRVQLFLQDGWHGHFEVSAPL